MSSSRDGDEKTMDLAVINLLEDRGLIRQSFTGSGSQSWCVSPDTWLAYEDAGSVKVK